MKIIRTSQVEPTPRPEGRTVKQLARVRADRFVEEAAVLLARHPAGLRETQHCHDKFFEIFFFLEDAEYLIEGEAYTLSAGDVVILEPGDSHGAIPVDHEVNILVFQLPYVPGDKRYADAVDAPQRRR